MGNLWETMTGWWFGTMEFYDFPYIGNIFSQLTNSIIFQRGRYTTNQMKSLGKHTDYIILNNIDDYDIIDY
jgi:hypothetical protein